MPAAGLNEAQLAEILYYKISECTDDNHGTDLALISTCSRYHRDLLDRRRFILSDKTLEDAGLSVHSAPKELLALLKEILQMESSVAWKYFRYKCRRCTNRDHKQQIALASLQTDACSFAHSQLEVDLHPQTYRGPSQEAPKAGGSSQKPGSKSSHRFKQLNSSGRSLVSQKGSSVSASTALTAPRPQAK